MKKRADGRYATKIVVGHKADKTPITKTIYGKTQKEVREKVAEIKVNGVQNKHNFKQLGEAMLESKETTVTHNSLKGYKENFKKLEDLFNMDIEDIEVTDVQSIIDKYASQGYSKSVLKKIKIVFGLVVKYAITENIKLYNFSSGIIIPKSAPVTKRKDLTDAEIEIIKKNVDTEFGLYPFLMLYTGLRRGELCALRYDDFDYTKNTISIKRAVEFINNQPRLKLPKTESGVRTIPLLKVVKSKLDTNGTGYIFGGEKIYSEQMIKIRWDNYCRVSGFTATQHQIRHAYATMLYKAGIDPKTAQHILGHADIQTTMNIYTHIAQSMQDGATEKLNEFLNSSQKVVKRRVLRLKKRTL